MNKLYVSIILLISCSTLFAQVTSEIKTAEQKKIESFLKKEFNPYANIHNKYFKTNFSWQPGALRDITFKIDSSFEDRWDTVAGDWWLNYLSAYHNLPTGNPDTVVTYNYGEGNPVGNLFLRQFNEYDLNGYPTMVLGQVYDTNVDSFRSEFRDLFDNDVYGNHLSYVFQNNVNSYLGNFWKEAWSYNDPNLPLMENQYDWSNNVWEPLAQATWTYNVNYPIRILGVNYNTVTGLFDELFSKDTFFYNANNQLTRDENYSYHQPDEAWSIDWREDYDYDNAGNLSAVTYYFNEPDSLGNQVITKTGRDLFTYSPQNLLLSDTTQSWNTTDNIFVDDGGLWTYSYDANSFLSLYTNYVPDGNGYRPRDLYSYQNDQYGNVLLSIRQAWDTTQNVWVNTYRFRNTYQQFNTGINNTSSPQNSFSLYPNPANTVVNIPSLNSGEEIVIESLQGNILMRVKGNRNQQINVSSLSNGIYLARIFDNEKISAVAKLVIDR